MHEVPLDCPVGPDFGLHMAKVGIPSGTGNSDTVSGRQNRFRTLVYIWQKLTYGGRLAWLVVQCSGQYSLGICESCLQS